ncbi:MAG: PQQ-like beta-propeller repeat protein [Verrucomicrobiae bacterium]|nr:PQQ-like beta-propeller repeat protein [Verrucomicrobiae bacterium]
MAQWPAFRGPNGNGTSNARIRTDWSVNPPRVLWRKGAAENLQGGFSSISVGGGRLFTMVKRNIDGMAQEVCVALDAETGKELWAKPLGPANYNLGGDQGAPGNTGGDGPRSTPTLSGNKVYVFTAWLRLACLDTQDGRIVWSVDFTRPPYEAPVIEWQNAASPLVVDGLVIVNCNAPSGRIVALNAETGAVVWRKHDDKMTHSTPVLAEFTGVRQVLFYAQSGLVSVDPATGNPFWRHSCSYNNVCVAASPVVWGDLVYCSAAYSTGARVVRVSKSGSTFTATQVRRTPGQFQNQWVTPVCHEGYLYGIFGAGEYGTAPLKCVKLDTLEEQWSQSGFGPGGVLLVRDKLIVLADNGTLVVVEPTPELYIELARFKALSGKCWNVPAVTDGRIYARSTTEIVALDVSVPPPPPIRLELVQIVPEGKLRVQIRNQDGTPISAERLSNLQVLTSQDVKAPIETWDKLTDQLRLDNGMAYAEETVEASSKRFFIVVEYE